VICITRRNIEVKRKSSGDSIRVSLRSEQIVSAGTPVNPAMMSNDNSEKTAGQSRLGPQVQSGKDWSASQVECLLEGFRMIAIERGESACGAATISKRLSHILNWKLWDQLLAQELADSIRSDLATGKHRL
jgi:hypothetical protein